MCVFVFSLWRQGKLGDALAKYTEALNRLKSGSGGKDTEEVATALNNIGLIYKDRKGLLYNI